MAAPSNKKLEELLRGVTVNDIQLYLACGVEPHPVLYVYFLSQLYTLVNSRKLSLTPYSILERFHNRLQKSA